MATLIIKRMCPSKHAVKKTINAADGDGSSERIQTVESLLKVLETRARTVQQQKPDKLLTSKSHLPSWFSDLNLQGDISPCQKAKLAGPKHFLRNPIHAKPQGELTKAGIRKDSVV